MMDGEHKQQILDKLLNSWNSHKHIHNPPSEPIHIITEGRCTVYIEDKWGPCVPYHSVMHSDGYINHGYLKLKGNPEAVASIPEVSGWPEYQKFLEIINSQNSLIESVGCEKSCFPIDKGVAKFQLGSYTDIIFSDYLLNEEPINFLQLVAALIPAMDGCEQWWSEAEFGLQILRGLTKCIEPWGLMIRISAAGRDEREARMCWGISVERLGVAISNFSIDYLNGRAGID